jgi:5-methylcytosine-specific restriction endonuclease McrA
LIVPHRRKPPPQGGRARRRYQRRCTVERTIAWLDNFRRLVVRYDRSLTISERIKLGIRTYNRLMKLVLERDDWQCQKCGSLENLPIHHQIKRSQLGDDALGNLLTLCARCHMAEHGHLGFAGKATQTANENLARGRHLHKAFR